MPSARRTRTRPRASRTGDAALGRDRQRQHVGHEPGAQAVGAGGRAVHRAVADDDDDEIFAGRELGAEHDMGGFERLGDQVLDGEAGGGLALAVRGERQRDADEERILGGQRDGVGAEIERRTAADRATGAIAPSDLAGRERPSA